jgi:uncharacterized protein YoxC
MSKTKLITTEAISAILDEKLSPILLTVNGLKDSVQFLSKKFDDVFKKVEELDNKVSHVTLENKHLKAELLRLSTIVDQQSNELDEIEQYSRRDCVEISGLPQENDEDLNKLVVKIGSLMDVELDERDISISHRLPKSRSENQQVNRSAANASAKIIVKFTRRDTKAKFYQGRLRLKDKTTRDLGFLRSPEHKLYISESLSPRKNQLFKKCLKFKRDKFFRYIWTYNGRIYLRKNSTSPTHAINVVADLEKLSS